MEAIIIVIFFFILLSCILAGYSILWALLFGYLMFFGYALRQGHTPVQVLTMSGRGIRTIKNILFIFILIGMITAVWRRNLIRHLFRRPLFTDVDQRPSDQRTDAD